MPTFSPRQTLSNLRYGRFNSAAARRLLSLFYREGAVYTVPFGQLKGVKLQYDPTINFHAMLGLWETESFELLTRLFAAGVLANERPVFCDVGANLGLYSIFLARQYPAATLYAFEPAPVVQRLLTNLDLNQLSNVIVVQQACSDQIGEVEFHLAQHHHSSSLHAGWAQGDQDTVHAIRVLATTLDDYFYSQRARPGPDFIKMDIEGGGTFALRGCDRCVQEKRPLFLIESHTPDEDRAISDLILRHTYDAYRLTNHRWVNAPGRTYPDPDGVWGTLLLWPAEKRDLAGKVLGS
jgi:FkbM family methyltransferase